ncbi:MAG: putative family protein/Domain of unknown function [Rhodoglobus sp.]|nr:putative family protein/Domain of unknown function [Rhodoglobus sp.]
MQTRGLLIRQAIPAQLRDLVADMVLSLPEDLQDLAVEGRDGTGQKSEVPWIRLFSRARSPQATDGWYLVYLFDAFGDRVYLSVNQGTNTWSKGDLHRRPDDEIVDRSKWAQNELGDDLAERSDLLSSISLPTRRSSLARGYELGNIYAIEYDIGALPAEDVLIGDFRYMANLLTLLYEYVDNALILPGDPAPEIIDAEMMVNIAAGRPRRGGKFRLLGSERRAIEMRAVEVTSAYLESEGYVVTDVGATESYDLDAVRATNHLFVEVKGTVGVGDQVILTRNEVALHHREDPHNMLAIVSRIHLDNSGMKPVATGGELRTISPWSIDSGSLVAIAFEYLVPQTDSAAIHGDPTAG